MSPHCVCLHYDVLRNLLLCWHLFVSWLFISSQCLFFIVIVILRVSSLSNHVVFTYFAQSTYLCYCVLSLPVWFTHILWLPIGGFGFNLPSHQAASSLFLPLVESTNFIINTNRCKLGFLTNILSIQSSYSISWVFCHYFRILPSLDFTECLRESVSLESSPSLSSHPLIVPPISKPVICKKYTWDILLFWFWLSLGILFCLPFWLQLPTLTLQLFVLDFRVWPLFRISPTSILDCHYFLIYRLWPRPGLSFHL